MAAPSLLDFAVIAADRVLKTLVGQHVPERSSPAEAVPVAPLEEDQRAHAAGLMRVNHAGEVCAQALYEGQALVARDARVRDALLAAAREEEDHLAWCGERLRELGQPSEPAQSAVVRSVVRAGRRHGIDGRPDQPRFRRGDGRPGVSPSRPAHERSACRRRAQPAIVSQMRDDEARHGTAALEAGGTAFPQPVKDAMTLVSGVMTATAYRV